MEVKGQYLPKEREKEREVKREICFVESYLRGKLMAWSLVECSSSFFRYHYTKGADAAAAASLSVTLREATKKRPLASSIPPRMEWSQNNLLFIGDIRSHSNPGNRFFPSSPFAISTAIPLGLRGFSVFRSAHNYFHSLESSCKQYLPARMHTRANWCIENRNLVETRRYSQPSRTWRRRYREA